MINIVHPFYKTEYLIKSYYESSQLLCNELKMTNHDLLVLIKESLAYEIKKEDYKLSLLTQQSIDGFLNFEKDNIVKTLSAFEMDYNILKELKLRINPYAKFVESPFVFNISDGKRLFFRNMSVAYCFIPKILATNELRIDEYPILGPLKFLLKIKDMHTSFTISQLINSTSIQKTDILVRRVKKMMLNQLLIID